MGVTNGFLRITRNEFKAIERDSAAFEQRCRDYNSPDYLDMDKAGYELLYILDPSISALDNPDAEPPFPAIAAVLGGGTVIHRDIDLGYGPAQIVSGDSMRSSLDEFKRLDFDSFFALASTDLLSEVLLVEADEAMLREYHWSYLQALAEFVAEAVERDMAILRY